VGMELTKYGTPQGVSSIQKLEKVTGQPESVIMKMMALAQKVQGDVAVGDETAGNDEEEVEEGVFDKDGMLGKFVKTDTGTDVTTGEPNAPTFMGFNVATRDKKIEGLKNALKIAQSNDGSGKVWKKGKVPTIKDVPRLQAELAKLEKEKAMQGASVNKDEVEEGKMANIAMGALLGLGAMWGAGEVTSAKNSPLGDALKAAAQAGDTIAMDHYKNLDLYVDGNDQSIMKMLNGKYLKKTIDDDAPPGAKAERMVKHIKKSYAKDGKLTDRERSIAYATAWKHHNQKDESYDGGKGPGSDWRAYDEPDVKNRWAVHIDGKKWKTFDSKTSAQRAAYTITTKHGKKTAIFAEDANDGVNIATNKRTQRMLNMIMARNPTAKNELEALLLAFDKGQLQDRMDINTLYRDDETIEQAVARLEKEIANLKSQKASESIKEEKQKGVDGKVCWKGYKRMGTKKKGGKTVDNCVKM